MTEPMGRRIAWGIIALWAMVYLWSIAALFLTAPTGDGFTRGLNRIVTFYGWQILAAALAFILLWAKRYFAPKSFARRLSWAPICLAGLLLTATLGFIAMANYGTPTPVAGGTPQSTAPAPVTAPAAPTR